VKERREKRNMGNDGWRDRRQTKQKVEALSLSLSLSLSL